MKSTVMGHDADMGGLEQHLPWQQGKTQQANERTSKSPEREARI